MEVVCSSCNELIHINDFFGTLNHPFCQTCWNDTYKGHEEDFIFSHIHKLEEVNISDKQKQLLIEF